jgi:RNA polymerase sigma-70 factor (ECF subfamily)
MAWRTFTDAPIPEPRTQRELVELAMGGDGEAFSALAAGAVRRMYAVARLILRNDAVAEDVTQEALVIAWRDLSALRDPSRFDAWLHRVLVRECYKQAHRERRRIAIEGRVRPIVTDGDPSQRSLVNDQIERGFAQLSLEHRAVLVLHHHLGYTIREIAEALGLPAGTVKSRLSRASLAMREALTSEAAPGPLKGGQPA